MNQAPYRLRRARPSDLPKLYEIDQRCFPVEIAYGPAELRAAMREPRSITLIAETAAETIAGFLIAHLPKPGTAHIITIDVLPEFRHRGLGNQLMDAAEEHFASRGAERVRLEAAVNNLSALRFYHQRGYRTVRRLPSYYPGPLDGLLLEKVDLKPGVTGEPAAAGED